MEPRVVEGARGEFTIRVGDTVVASKSSSGFPDEKAVVRTVKEALG